MTDDATIVAGIVDDSLATWDRMRRTGPRLLAARRFRKWLFHTVPGQAGTDPDTHAFLVFEVASGCYERGDRDGAFLLLRWLGRHFARHPDAAVATRAVMALTDTCLRLGTIDAVDNRRAYRVMREVGGARGVDVRVERALCRLAVHTAFLRSDAISAWRPGRRHRDLARLWAGIVRRWRGATDPELRGRVAQALTNQAYLHLRAGDEPAARRRLAEVAAMPVDDEVLEWRLRAEHAGTVLDRLVIGEPELKLDYLRRQRYWDRRRRRQGLGLPWLLAGAPRNHMAGLVRRAREQHRRSAGTVRSWLCSGEPFVLLLRNFELSERSGTSAPPTRPGDGDHTRTIFFRACGPALNELAAGVPLVLAASTKAAELEVAPWPGQFAPRTRLYLPDTTWFDTVSALAAVADQVIVWAAELSPALARELECLRERGRTRDTLILLEDTESDTAVDAYLPRDRHERLTRDHPALAAFPHVVEAAEVARENGPLTRVVAGLTEARAVPLADRLIRIRDALGT